LRYKFIQSFDTDILNSLKILKWILNLFEFIRTSQNSWIRGALIKYQLLILFYLILDLALRRFHNIYFLLLLIMIHWLIRNIVTQNITIFLVIVFFFLLSLKFFLFIMIFIPWYFIHTFKFIFLLIFRFSFLIIVEKWNLEFQNLFLIFFFLLSLLCFITAFWIYIFESHWSSFQTAIVLTTKNSKIIWRSLIFAVLKFWLCVAKNIL